MGAREMTALALATDRDFLPTIDQPFTGVWLRGGENTRARRNTRERIEPVRKVLSDPEQLPTVEQSETTGFSDAEPRWLSAALQRIEHIRNLDDNWDGYGAGPIRADVLSYALRLLQTVMDDAPAPQLTPMSHEGVLIEWARGGVHLEIEIEDAGEAFVSYEDEGKGIDKSWKVKADFASLEEPLRAIAAQPA
jgi:hypothetical protein